MINNWFSSIDSALECGEIKVGDMICLLIPLFHPSDMFAAIVGKYRVIDVQDDTVGLMAFYSDGSMEQTNIVRKSFQVGCCAWCDRSEMVESFRQMFQDIIDTSGIDEPWQFLLNSDHENRHDNATDLARKSGWEIIRFSYSQEECMEMLKPKERPRKYVDWY